MNQMPFYLDERVMDRHIDFTAASEKESPPLCVLSIVATVGGPFSADNAAPRSDNLGVTAHTRMNPSGRGVAQQMGQCRGRTHVPMALEPQHPGAATLPQGSQRTGNANRYTRLTHDTGAWKLNVDAQREVVPLHSGDGLEAHREPRGAAMAPLEQLGATC